MDGPVFARLVAVLGRHRGLAGLLTLHALLYWGVLTAGSPFATASVECAAGGAAEAMLAGGARPWGLLDTFDGALGGMFVAAAAGFPLFALAGVTVLTTKGVAWGFALAVLLVVYLLLDRHESRPAALLAVAGLGFAPPLLWHVSAVFGNWHWTELLFDYGVGLGALELLRAHRAGRAPGPLPWAALGGVTGLGVFNCFGSLPFLAACWGGLLLALLPGRLPPPRPLLVRGFAVALGLLGGSAPYWIKAFLHAPFGLGGASPAGALPGMLRFGFEPAKALDLVGPGFVGALHVQDLLPLVQPSVAWSAAATWVLLSWLGVLLAVAATPGRRARGQPVLGGAVPLVFVAVFALGYVVVGMPIERLPDAFSNLRETTHRPLPPLVAALAVGAAVGWSRLASSAGRRSLALQRLLLALAAVPALVGGSTLVAGALGPVDVGRTGLQVYRPACFDVGGFFASPWYVGEPEALQERCGGWEEPGRVRECRAGAAWGVGYYRVGGVVAGCEALPDALRGDCLRGIGWAAGEKHWGGDAWPLTTCNALGEADRAGCWRGVGFLVGDHLHPTPWRMEGVIRRAPRARQGDVARGAGYGLGRTYAGSELPFALCDRLSPDLLSACRAGVEEATADR